MNMNYIPTYQIVAQKKTGITVAELIVLLQGMPQDAPVMVAHQYEDCWKTVVALSIKSAAQSALLFNENLGVFAVDPDGELVKDSPVVLGAGS